MVKAALNKAWEFVVPFSFVVLGPNKVMFKFMNQDHIAKSFNLATWNVGGFLLVPKPWSLSFTMGEVILNMSPFWIQVHGCP